MCSLGNATAERAAFDYLASLHFRPCSATTPLSIRPHDQTMAGMAHELTQLVRTFHHASLYGRTLVVERPRASRWLWTMNTSFTLGDVYWPSSCDRKKLGHHETQRRVAVREKHCNNFRCGWANAVPAAMRFPGPTVSRMLSVRVQCPDDAAARVNRRRQWHA